MRNFIANFVRIHGICKHFAANRVNEHGNVPRGGVVPKVSDQTAASVHNLHYLKDVRWEYHNCLMLGDKGYLSAEVQKNLFETANIRLEVPYRLNQKNYRPPIWTYKRIRKLIETVFSQLNDQLMMIRNYAIQTCGLFARITGKIAAMTFMQYVNLTKHRPIC